MKTRPQQNPLWAYICNLMMSLLRKKILKRIFSCLLLGVLMLKFFAYSISSFSSFSGAYAIEKSAEENKDKEEESFEKAKKKLQIYETSIPVYEHPTWTSHIPDPNRMYKIRIGSFPARNVPTPPPNSIS